ncbi:MAG TPA: hypothetical protein VE974_13115 [Thermoanaerobaculia bacterium]|nr:hypothetical protein [Thermoanaerobaculia bacterium]
MFLVPLLLVASTLHAGPERSLTAPLPNASPYSQFAGEVVAGDETALLTWAGPGVHAARIGRDGRSLDARPIDLGGQSCGGLPVVARAGGKWLVLWCQDQQITGRFVADDGTTGPLRRFGAWPNPQAIRVAFDGTHFLVAWSQWDSLRALRLDRDGNVVEPEFVVDAIPFWQQLDLVAFDSGFAIVAVRYFTLENDYTIDAIRLDTNGDRLAHTWLDRTSAGVGSLDVIADGDQLAAVWTAAVAGSRVFVAHEGEPLRVVSEGEYVSERIFELGGTVYVLLRGPQDVRLVAEDSSLERAWNDVSSAINASGAVLGDRLLVAATHHYPSSIDQDLSITMLDAALQDVRPFERFSHDPPLQEQPAIARNAHGETLAVWFESGNRGGVEIAAMPLNGAGQPLLRRPIVVGQSLYPLHRPRVASDGTDYVVVWTDSAARVKRDGTVIPLLLREQSGVTPCATWNGEEYLIGYLRITRYVSGKPRLLQVWRKRVSREGAVLADEAVSGEGDIRSVACADNLFVWTDDGRVAGAFVTNGAFTMAPGPTTHPAVTRNGDRYLVAWSGALNTVQRALVNEHGTVTLVSDALLPGDTPGTAVEEIAVAPYGKGFILAWGQYDLHAITLDRDGHAASPTIDVSVTPAVEREAAIAGGETPIVVYMRELGGTNRWRVFTRTLTDDQPRRRATRH